MMRQHSMRLWGGWLCLAVAVSLMAGCPFIKPIQYTFTSANQNGYRNFWDVLSPWAEDSAEFEGDTGGEAPEREVVEPDVIRRDGNLLYVLNQYRGLTIADLDTNKLLAQVPTYGYPRDLYVVDGKAYVLTGYAVDYAETDGVITVDVGSRIYVVDVADPATAAVTGSFELAGDFQDSRLVGDVLYAVSANFEWQYGDVAEDGTVSVGDVGAKMDWNKQQTSSSWVTSVNLADPANIAVADTLSFDGYGSIIQATNFAMFVASYDWNTDQSVITYVDIADPDGAIAVRGNIAVSGNVADRFKMDAYQGVLRVVSNTNWQNRNVYVTTVDLANPDALAVLGSTTVEGAVGETLFATRFDGPRAYVVSYLIKDPLFVLDLSDPTMPKVAGILEVPGWSTYIEPQGDRLVALGVDDTDGMRRVCVSLFDVTDPAAPALLDRETFGDNWSWSSAYSDVKAFTVTNDMLIVPFSGWTDSGGYERLQFIGYTHDALDLGGYVDLQGSILRSFEYGQDYFGVTSEQLAKIQIGSEGPVVVDTLTLAENVADYQPLTTCGAEVLLSYSTLSAAVRTVDNAGETLGEVEFPMTNIAGTHAYGDKVVIVGTGYDTNGYYDVVVVDCADPATPVIAQQIRVDVNPVWGWYYYDYAMMPEGGMVDKSADKMAPYYWWWGWNTSDSTFLVGDMLVLQCYNDKYDEVLGSGDGTAYQGLALVNLESGEWTDTVGLGLSYVESLHAANGKIYISTREDAGIDLLLRPLCAYYLRAFDPSDVSLGPAVNVPGSFVQYTPGTEVLVLQDVQYNADWNVTRTLRSVKWDGGDNAVPVDDVSLPNYGQILGRGAKIYFDAYDQKYVTGVIEVAASGNLTAGSKIEVTDQYASLVDADGNNAYLCVAGGAIARYDFSGDTPALMELKRVMSTPAHIRFGADAAYAPLGYAGLATLGR